MWVFDQRTAMVPVNGRTTRDGVYVVSGGPFVRSLRHWAMTLWRHGKTIDQVADDAEGGPTPFERRVLLLMSSGVTDAVAARQLGVTERTFRRHAAAILRRLGATSRFQAGVRAVERGWL